MTRNFASSVTFLRIAKRHGGRRTGFVRVSQQLWGSGGLALGEVAAALRDGSLAPLTNLLRNRFRGSAHEPPQGPIRGFAYGRGANVPFVIVTSMEVPGSESSWRRQERGGRPWGRGAVSLCQRAKAPTPTSTRASTVSPPATGARWTLTSSGGAALTRVLTEGLRNPSGPRVAGKVERRTEDDREAGRPRLRTDHCPVGLCEVGVEGCCEGDPGREATPARILGVSGGRRRYGPCARVLPACRPGTSRAK